MRGLIYLSSERIERLRGMPSMARRRRLLVFLLAALLTACVQAPLFPAAAPLLPPLAPDQARIYFYREWEVSESVSYSPRVYLNGVPAGIVFPGGVFYRDVPAPEIYLISVDTNGVFWDPFKTVALQPGQKLYVQIESLDSWGEGRSYQKASFVVAVIDPEQAERELAGMRYVQDEER
jgi:hypothetical protein